MTILLIGMVSAQEEVVQNYPPDNFIGRIISGITYFLHQGTFTIYGREMACGVQPQKTTYWQRPIIPWSPQDDYKFSEEKTCGGNSFFVNFYRGKNTDQYLGEYYYYKGTVYVTDGEGKGGIYTKQYYGKTALRCDTGVLGYCSVEIYCCDNGACESNSDCGSDEECSKTYQISSLFPSLGICQEEEFTPPTHPTKTYKCNPDGTATYLRDVVFGNKLFCPIEGENNYLEIGGGVTGVCYTEDKMPCKVTGETGGTTGTGGIFSRETLTFPEFLELSDILGTMKSVCTSDLQCPKIDNYKSVSCENGKIYQNRIIEITKDNCKELYSTVTLNIPIISPLISGIICTVTTNPVKLIIQTANIGVCVAKEPEGLTGIWEGYLRAIFNLGIPVGWVVLTAIAILIIILILIITLIRK